MKIRKQNCKKMKRIMLLLLFLPGILMFATDAKAQEIQGSTEGDKAVTYDMKSGYVALFDINDDLVPDDGTVEIPATVAYNGHDYPVYYQGLIEDKATRKVRKLIIHGAPYGFHAYKISGCFPKLEEITTVDDVSGSYHAKDGVLYAGSSDNPYKKLIWCPIEWRPEGRQLFQEGTTQIGWRACWKVKRLNATNELVIPDRMSVIEESAFMESELRSVALPAHADYKVIEKFLFWHCDQLTNVVIPDNVESVEYGALADCSCLSAIDLNRVRSLGSFVFRWSSRLTTITGINHLSNLAESCFAESSLHSIDLSQTPLSALPADAFFNCTQLREIHLPATMEGIGDFAFCGCSALRHITLPERLKTLGHWVFKMAALDLGIESIHLPATLENVTGHSFADASALRSITVDPANPYLVLEDGVLFNSDKTILLYYPCLNGRKSYKVPPTVREIADGAFYMSSRSNLTHVVLPSSCTRIGYDAFRVGDLYGLDTDGLSVTVPPTVKVFGGEKKWDRESLGFQDPYTSSISTFRAPSNVFKGYSVYLMGTSPEGITAQPEFFSSRTGSQDYIYVTKTAYDKLTASTAPEVWREGDVADRLSCEVPVTLSGTGLSTMCRDFDVDLSQSGGLEAYVAASFRKGTDYEPDVMQMERVSTGSYLPSRYGTDNYEFCGVMLKGTPGTTYTYRIGEQDYTSGSQTELTDAQLTGNMLVGAPVHVNIGMTDGDKTNFALKDGKFRHIIRYGELSWNKAYLQIPTVAYQAAGAKGVCLSFSDTGETTGVALPQTAEEGSAVPPYYDLGGVRVEHPRNGVYIHNGKKIVIE